MQFSEKYSKNLLSDPGQSLNKQSQKSSSFFPPMKSLCPLCFCDICQKKISYSEFDCVVLAVKPGLPMKHNSYLKVTLQPLKKTHSANVQYEKNCNLFILFFFQENQSSIVVLSDPLTIGLIYYLI